MGHENHTNAPPNIRLCLSGGGFRATLFHLGVIRALRVTGLLGSVREIFSVSGGSILAAHLVLHWADYVEKDESDFNGAVAKLIAFTQSNLRGRIVRRLHRSPTQVLQQLYGDELFDNKPLEALAGDGRPALSLLATNVSTGEPARFTAEGLSLNIVRSPRSIASGNQPIALAVAASSAFPGLFPPLEITAESLVATKQELETDVLLTDGGVYDNLGTWALRTAVAQDDAAAAILSDASLGFDWTPVRRQWRITRVMSTISRSFGISARRVYDFEQAVLERDRIDAVLIGRVVATAPCLKPEVQKQLQFVRTDFDRFKDFEVRALAQHGFEVAREVLVASPRFARFAAPLIGAPLWEPLDALAPPGSGVDGPEPQQSTHVYRRPPLDPRQLYRSRRRRLLPAGALLTLLGLLLLAASAVYWWRLPVVPARLQVRVYAARSDPDPLTKYPWLASQATELAAEAPTSGSHRILVIESDPLEANAPEMDLPVTVSSKKLRIVANRTRLIRSTSWFQPLVVDASGVDPVVRVPPSMKGDRFVFLALEIGEAPNLPSLNRDPQSLTPRKRYP